MTALAATAARLRKRALFAGVAGVVACALAWWFDAPRLLASWLVAWLFFLGIALGAMVNVMIHELTGGTWGFAIRPPLEAAIGTLPALAVLGIPVVFGLSHLYPWATAGATGDPILAGRLWYLNIPGFTLRALVYFAAWIAIGYALRRHWRNRSTNAASPPVPALRVLSALGLLVYAVTATLAAVDWIMSLSAHWYSSVFGLLFMVLQALSAFAFAVAATVFGGGLPGRGANEARNAQDLGNLLLMFVMTWAYLAFTQFLIIWAEDLPSEIGWYVVRAAPPWRWLAVGVFALQFVLPFGAMLLRSFKRDPRRLAWLCVVVLVAHGGELLWLVVPALRVDLFWLQWTDAAAFLAIGGLWSCALLYRLDESPSAARVGLAETVNHG